MFEILDKDNRLFGNREAGYDFHGRRGTEKLDILLSITAVFGFHSYELAIPKAKRCAMFVFSTRALLERTENI